MNAVNIKFGSIEPNLNSLRQTRFLQSAGLCLLLVCFAPQSGSADLVINEIDADDSGIDDREFIELFNNGPEAIDLGDYSLLGVNGSNESVYFGVDLDAAGFLTPGGFFVLGSSEILADLPPTTLSLLLVESLQNGPDAIVLFEGPASDFRVGLPPSGSEVVDVVHYGTNDSPDPELSAIYPDAIYVDEGALGDKDTDSIGRIPNGLGPFGTLDLITPGFQNSVGVPEPGCTCWLGLLSYLTSLAYRRRKLPDTRHSGR